MTQVVLFLEEKYAAQRQKCLEWTRHRDQMQVTRLGHSAKGEAQSNSTQVYLTWQWKRLMIKLTLVKALNGIYFHTVAIGSEIGMIKYGKTAQL